MSYWVQKTKVNSESIYTTQGDPPLDLYVANDHNPPGLKQDEIDNKISKDGGEVVSSVDDVKWEKLRGTTFNDNDVEFDED